MPEPILEISDLCVDLACDGNTTSLISEAGLSISAGRTLALVGESGCGKSLTSLSILRLLPSNLRVSRGTIRFAGRNLLELSEREMQPFRGGRIGMIFQEPMTALNPLLRVGEQIAEPLRVHRGLSARAARREAVELLRQVGIAAPDRRVDSYPHEMSGGMRQRVMIAMAIACRPELLIADEPTTALDVTVQAQILDLLRRLQQQMGMAILFITHDLAVVAEFADEVSVMYAGGIVEHAPTSELITEPRHPYTRALLGSVLPLESMVAEGESTRRLRVVPGDVPRPGARPAGCAFHPRCGDVLADGRCSAATPRLESVAPNRSCACWLLSKSR